VSTTQERLADALQAAARAVREDTLRPLSPGRRRRRLPVLAPVAAAVSVVVIVGLIVALSPLGHRGSQPAGSGAAPTVAVGGYPTGIALDAAHDTIYVSAGSANGLSMIDTATCNSSDQVGCAHTGRVATAGQDPIGVAVDEQTSTVYAVNGESGTVAVINSATCNATDTQGCSRPPALVNVPGGPEFLAIDAQTNTIYVADTSSGTVSVIDGSTCNASDVSGCAKAPATVSVGTGAFPITVDPATNTVYVGVTAGLAVIDGNTCDSSDTSGCVAKPAMIAVGNEPAGISVDQVTGTVYVSGESGTVAVADRNTCDAADTAGCANGPVMVPVGTDPRGDAIDAASHTVYVTNAGSNTVSMLDTATCNYSSHGSCGSAQPAFPVGSSPRRIAVDPATHTVYIVNVGASTVSMISSLSCNASDSSGCPTKSPAGTGVTGGRVIGGVTGGPGGAVSTCSPTVSALGSGEPAGALTASSREVASGSTGGQSWSLWAKKGVTGVNAIEDGGLVLGGRWYGLCAGYPNVGELELIDASPAGIAYGFVAIPGKIGVTLTSGGALPAPQVRQVAAGITFFIGQLPRSACSYPTMVLNASGSSGSSMHHLAFGSCQAGKLVSITESNGEWGSGPVAGSAPSSFGAGSGNLAHMQDDCSPQATAASSGQPAGSLTSSSVKVAAGLVGGQPWSLWSEKGAAGVVGVAGIENGGLVLGGRWYGLCPGPPNPAEFELIDAGSHGIVYGYVANPGSYSIKLTSAGALPAPLVRQVQGGTFFIAALPKSACSYPTMVLNATTATVSDYHHLGFGSCQAGKLVAISESDGSW
jgi:DNA-binding beta-propeller fold protein YncE